MIAELVNELTLITSAININFIVLIFITLLFIYFGHKIFKLLTFSEIFVDLSENKWNYKDFDLKRMYNLEELPPFYPNGWISVLESSDLKPNQIKPVFGFGYDLVVYRGNSGNVYVFDAYCPHLGAHLAIGGQILDDSIRCPFHGWTFNSEGQCTHVPSVECSNIPKLQIKVWDSIEVNGFIFVWHHSDQQKPDWFPIKVNEIEDSKLVYRGRAHHIVNCHLQEIPENGADVMHLNELHSGPEFLGTVINRSKLYDVLIKYLRYEWKANWQPCPPPDQHIAQLDLRSVYSLFGYPLMPFSLSVQQIGPANVHLRININFLGQIKGYIIQTITPLAPMKHKIVHHFYTEPTLKALIFSKFMIYGEARMIERDIVVWNNKKFLKQPYFAKNESSLVKFRRWFNQFYTEKCPKNYDK